ncbi:radical SAM protein [Pelomonas sp. Root1237]|uniref:radical SAM protein n=1 Tax=Pelomonas sp. Root1237 TaxID=1736434 RepID=UPI000A52B4DB|nr:radical SAM protein [Pelomonas sp. Root1237]
MDSATNDLLWSRYPVFNSGSDYVVLDAVSLESVFLNSSEIKSLNTGKDSAAKRLLTDLGFSELESIRTNRDSLLLRLANSQPRSAPERVCGFRIVVTDKCNMDCKYCFVQTNTGAKDITQEELEEGLTFLFESNQGRDKVSIQWFGGEPTIRFDLMEYGDHFARSLAKKLKVRGVQHTVVTNGMRITDKMLSHFKEFHYGVGVSYDGPPAINQKYRTLLNGTPADSKIERSISKLVGAGDILVGLNITPTPFNYDNLNQIVEYGISSLGVRFLYANTPIPATGKWEVPGKILAESLVNARFRALQLGGIFHSAADRVYQALDARRSTAYEHLQAGNAIVAALLPGSKISICDINWKNPEFIFPIEKIRADSSLLTRLNKEIAPYSDCERCPAIAVCGGPSKNDAFLTSIDLPDPEFCAFYQRLVELALWDDTGLQ